MSHRCNSTLPSTNCIAQNVTRWHSTLAQHITSIDPNHMISSGYASAENSTFLSSSTPFHRIHGFFCTGCPKLFPRPIRPPGPRPSAKATIRRGKVPAALSKRDLIKDRADKRKRTRQQMKRDGTLSTNGIQVRGSWVSTTTRRQNSGLGSAFDGSEGVDSEDILGIPQIAFGSSQLFPDQDHYEPADPNLPPFNNTVQVGLEWIKLQVQTAQLYDTLKFCRHQEMANISDFIGLVSQPCSSVSVL
jgi:mannan endo-1,4-beta-mannosidase